MAVNVIIKKPVPRTVRYEVHAYAAGKPRFTRQVPAMCMYLLPDLDHAERAAAALDAAFPEYDFEIQEDS